MSILPTRIATPNVHLSCPDIVPGDEDLLIVFFITGNPGLIGYYHNFLDLLHPGQPSDAPHSASITSRSGSRRCVITGFSLGGFDVRDEMNEAAETSVTRSNEKGKDDQNNHIDLNDLIYPSHVKRKDVMSLRDQIELCYARLSILVGKLTDVYSMQPKAHQVQEDTYNETEQSQSTNRKVKVILMGHSVGAYIVLEMIKIHHTNSNTQAAAASTHPSFTITSAILLTPTILNISHSTSGRLATPLLSYLPFLPTLLNLSSSILTSLLPSTQLKRLVSTLTGMPTSSPALEATVSFLRSGKGVKQALSMANEEMRDITGDKWGEEVWGVMEQTSNDKNEGMENDTSGKQVWEAPRLYFWFAKQDHWVADVTRDEIVAIVNAKGAAGKAEVVVDETDGLVHAWCIQQSELVAQRVRRWIDEVVMREE